MFWFFVHTAYVTAIGFVGLMAIAAVWGAIQGFFGLGKWRNTVQ